MDHGPDQNDSLLKVGADYARDIHALCADVSAVIFPSAISPPTDAMINAASSTLLEIIGDIETRLSPWDQQSPPQTWEMLARSGFLREAELIDFVLARVSEDRLSVKCDDGMATMTARLLDHADGNIADTAQMLLAAESLHRLAAGNSYLGMPAELLHKTVWRVVAALEVIHGTRQQDVVAAARALIAQYAEANRIQAAARKIVHFMDASEQGELLDPKVSGLQLHVAAISASLDFEHDHVLRLIDASSSAPYAILLRAMGVPKAKAIDALFLLRGEMLSSREAGIIDSGYDLLDIDAAKAETGRWTAARAHYLAFGQA